jgi:hypothetical protein
MEANQEPLDFENTKLNTINKQFKAYLAQHPKSKIKTIKEFTAEINQNPHHYKEHTVKRALKHQNKSKTTAKKAVANEEEVGGKLSANELHGLINSSYENKTHDLDDFDADHELSDDRVKVYKRKGDSKDAVVVHRGTQGLSDQFLDAKYIMGKDINNSDRFRHSADIQKKAEDKYGAKNISTVGHSLGAKIASDVGQNSKEIINLNKAVASKDIGKKVSSKETNIRTKYDPVSAAMGLFGLRKDKNTFTIPSTSLNPLKEHSTEVLKRLDPNQMFGI